MALIAGYLILASSFDEGEVSSRIKFLLFLFKFASYPLTTLLGSWSILSFPLFDFVYDLVEALILCPIGKASFFTIGVSIFSGMETS